MNKNVFKTNNGVKINFTGVVQKQQIVKMVENCATGQCECMSDATKKKISNMQVEGKDGNVELQRIFPPKTPYKHLNIYI